MTYISLGHLTLTPTQSLLKTASPPEFEFNPGPPDEKTSALPLSYLTPRVDIKNVCKSLTTVLTATSVILVIKIQSESRQGGKISTSFLVSLQTFDNHHVLDLHTADCYTYSSPQYETRTYDRITLSKYQDA